MRLPSMENLLWVAGFIGEILLIAVILRRQLWRSFPFFTAYIALEALSDLIAYWFLRHASQHVYLQYYFTTTILDFVIELLVLIEIALHVLRPVKRSLPKTSLQILAGVCLITVAAALLFAPHGSYSGNRLLSLTFHISLGFAIARVLIFILIAAFSQVLGITWRNHVLQLTTGLAFYSAIAIFVQLQLSHLGSAAAVNTQGKLLANLQSAADIATLLFWSWAFSQNEAPRKEFSPQMEAVLVTIAGTAKRTRVAVTRSLGPR